jgi:hypothetical protein
MPAKPQWLPHIPQILEQLLAMDVPVVERGACEKLFGVGRRQAIELMPPVSPSWSGLGGGNTPMAKAQAFRNSWERAVTREEEDIAILTRDFVFAGKFDTLAARLRSIERTLARRIAENQLRKSAANF